MERLSRRELIKLAITDIMRVSGSGIHSVDLLVEYFHDERPFHDTLQSTEFFECLDELVTAGQLLRDGSYYHCPAKTD